ncbi:hypothetical protein SUGI_0069880 [Cryptomeria japonica]|nr:hypothetical protein SUGI_0069880 [Cryptomeria japonica]
MGDCEDSFDDRRTHSWRLQHDDDPEVTQSRRFVQNPREVVTMAQDVVSTMLSKGYILGKGALRKAKAFDESHQIIASAAANVVSLGQKIGINDKLIVGAQCIKSVEERYHVSEETKAMFSPTE